MNPWRLDANVFAVVGADELNQFLHGGRGRVRSAAVRALYKHTDPGLPEEALRGQMPHFVIERFGVGGVRVEVCNSFLQRGQDSRGVGERFFRHEAVHFVTQANIDAADEPSCSRELTLRLRRIRDPRWILCFCSSLRDEASKNNCGWRSAKW